MARRRSSPFFFDQLCGADPGHRSPSPTKHVVEAGSQASNRSSPRKSVQLDAIADTGDENVVVGEANVTKASSSAAKQRTKRGRARSRGRHPSTSGEAVPREPTPEPPVLQQIEAFASSRRLSQLKRQLNELSVGDTTHQRQKRYQEIVWSLLRTTSPLSLPFSAEDICTSASLTAERTFIVTSQTPRSFRPPVGSFVVFEPPTKPQQLILGQLCPSADLVRVADLTVEHLTWPDHTAPPCAVCAHTCHLFLPTVLPTDLDKDTIKYQHAFASPRSLSGRSSPKQATHHKGESSESNLHLQGQHPARPASPANKRSRSRSASRSARNAANVFTLPPGQGLHFLEYAEAFVRAETADLPHIVSIEPQPLFRAKGQPSALCKAVPIKDDSESGESDEEEPDQAASASTAAAAAHNMLKQPEDKRERRSSSRLDAEVASARRKSTTPVPGSQGGATKSSKKQTVLHFSIKDEDQRQRGWATSPQMSFNPERLTLQEWASGRVQMAQCAAKFKESKDAQAISDAAKGVSVIENYACKRRFLSLYNGTGCAFYPTGRIAVCTSCTKSGTYVLAYSDTSPARLLAAFTPFGHGSCFSEAGALRLVYGDGGGIISDDGIVSFRQWTWSAATSINMRLNDYITVQVHGRSDVHVNFRHPDVQVAPGPSADEVAQKQQGSPSSQPVSLASLENAALYGAASPVPRSRQMFARTASTDRLHKTASSASLLSNSAGRSNSPVGRSNSPTARANSPVRRSSPTGRSTSPISRSSPVDGTRLSPPLGAGQDLLEHSADVDSNVAGSEASIKDDLDKSSAQGKASADKVFHVNVGMKTPLVRPSLVPAPQGVSELLGLKHKANILLQSLQDAIHHIGARTGHATDIKTMSRPGTSSAAPSSSVLDTKRKAKKAPATSSGVSVIALPLTVREAARSRPATVSGDRPESSWRKKGPAGARTVGDRPSHSPRLAQTGRPPTSGGRLTSATTGRAASSAILSRRTPSSGARSKRKPLLPVMSDGEIKAALQNAKPGSTLVLLVTEPDGPSEIGSSSSSLLAAVESACRQNRSLQDTSFAQYHWKDTRTGGLQKRHGLRPGALLVYVGGQLVFLGLRLTTGLPSAANVLQQVTKCQAMAKRGNFLPQDFRLA